MGLLFTDSFDDRTSMTDGAGNPFKYDSMGVALGDVTIGAGGRTNNRLIIGYSNGAESYTKNVGTLATFYCGFAFGSTAGAATDFLGFYDGSTLQLKLTLNSGGTISLYRGDGTLLATSADAIGAGMPYIEFSATIHPSAGAYTLKMNGITEATATGVNTRNSSNNQITKFTIFGSSAGAKNLYMDDLYFADDAFHGGLKIVALLPSGAGNSTVWTPDSGSNYARVNEVNPDDNTSYVYSPTIGDKDLYAYANLPDNTVTVRGVQLWTRHERDDAVTRKFKPVVRSAGTDYDQAEATTSQNVYHDDLQMFLTDPATSAAWLGSAVDAAQFGVKVTV